MSGQDGAFANLLRRHRHAAGLTQEELAERAAISVRAVSDLERGLRTRPHRPTLQQLADALGLTAKDRAALDAAARRTDPITRSAPDRADRALPVGGFLGTRPSGPLVARDDEVVRILAWLDTVTQGEGRVVLVAGEPGIGKTRLAQEVMLALQHRDVQIATGRCYEPQHVVAYFPFLDVLAQLEAAAPAAVRSEISERWPALAPLLPGAPVSSESAIATSPDDQHRLFRIVSSFIQAVAETVPLAILLDDLQWADQASLDLLQYLARSTRGVPVFLLGLYRDVAAARRHVLEELAHNLRRDGLVEQVQLRHLDEDGTGALVASILGEEVSEEFFSLIHGATAGNPFFVVEVLRTLIERGDLQRGPSGWERREIGDIVVPASIQAAVRERYARLTDEAREFLTDACVLGQTFTFGDLRALRNRDEMAVEAALEAAIATGLVQAIDGETYRFSHALTHRALYSDLPPRTRRRLHRMAGEAVERLPERRRGERAAELAVHFLEAEVPDKALRYSHEAGDRAEAVFAHAEAEHHYRTARELAEEVDDSSAQAAACRKLGVVLKTVGRYDDAAKTLERSFCLYAQLGDEEGERLVMAQLGRVHRYRASLEEGIARIEQYLGEARIEPSPALAEIYVSLALLYGWRGKHREGQDAAERAAEMAKIVGDDRLLAEAQVRRAEFLFNAGEVDEARHLLEEGLPLAESIDDPEILHPYLIDLGSDIYKSRGQFSAAETYLERSLQVAEQGGNIGRASFSLFHLGDIRFDQGDWEGAVEYFQRAISLVQPLGPSSYGPYPLIGLARVRIGQGHWEDAAELLEEGIAGAEGRGDAGALLFGHAALAEWDILHNRPDAALPRLTAHAGPLRVAQGGVPVALDVPLAWAHLEVGNVMEAHRVIARAVTQARAYGSVLDLVNLLRIEGMVLSRQGRWAQAEQDFEEAASLARQMTYPYGEARALYEWGCLERHQPGADPARQHLQDALAIFERLGARPYAEWARQALAGPSAMPSEVGALQRTVAERPR